MSEAAPDSLYAILKEQCLEEGHASSLDLMLLSLIPDTIYQGVPIPDAAIQATLKRLFKKRPATLEQLKEYQKLVGLKSTNLDSFEN